MIISDICGNCPLPGMYFRVRQARSTVVNSSHAVSTDGDGGVLQG